MSSIIKCNRILHQGRIKLEDSLMLQEEHETIDSEIQPIVSKEEVDHLLHDALSQAEAIREKAMTEAEEIVLRAKQQAERMCEEAEDVMRKANEAHMNEMQEREAEIERREALSQNRIQEAHDEMLQSFEPEVVALVEKLLRRIVDEKVISGKEWLECIVHKIIKTEYIAEPITIYLSEECFSTMQERLTEGLKDYPYALTIEMDLKLEDGACVVETASGGIYYDLRNNLEDAIRELRMLLTIDKK